MTPRFVVVHESEADFNTATELADRVLVDAIDWLDEHLLVHQREWVGAVDGHRRLSWKAIPQMAREIGIKAHGHFDGKPGEADAAAARRAILYLLEAIPDLTAILLVRDQDDQPERRIGLDQAQAQYISRTTIIVGLAVVEREAWVISGFEPQTDEETARLEAEKRALGFNPCERSHELTACKNDQAKRSPKRVLRQLSGTDPERERFCWNNTPIDRLRQRGGDNGLAAYLNEVQKLLAVRIGHAT
jgi:hypothetical protein